MNREIKADYSSLLKYIENLNYCELLTEKKFTDRLKSMHKKTFSLIVFKNEFVHNKGFGYFDENSLKYLQEVTSDLVFTLLCYINGLYKPAKLQLRCSIENFLKAVLYQNDKDVIVEKNVYNLFDRAYKNEILNNEICMKKLNSIHSIYKSLCLAVHGDITELYGSDAMIKYPLYEDIQAEDIYNQFLRLLDSYLSILYFHCYSKVFCMHVNNRDLFLSGLTKTDKSDVVNSKVCAI